MELLEARCKDFCCFGEISLPLKNAGLVWVGGENKDSKAADNNGSGKSTIFKLITWTLFGQTIDGEKGDKIIRSGAKQAVGEVDLSDGSEVWTIRRTRKKGSPLLEIIQPDGDTFKASKDEVQAKVIDMIGGLDFLAFKNTVLYGQNDASRFADSKTKDSDRKEMLHKILRTGILKFCHEWASKKRLSTKKEISSVETEKEKVVARMEEIDIDGLISKASSYDEETKLIVEELTEEVEEKRARVEELERQLKEGVKEDSLKTKKKRKKLKSELDKLSKRLSKASEYKETIEKFKSDIVDLEKHKEHFDKKLNSRVEKIHAAASEIRVLEKQMKNLSSERCPVCTTSLGSGKAKKHIEHLKRDLALWEKRLLTRTEKRDGIVSKISKIALAIERLEEAVDEADTKYKNALMAGTRAELVRAEITEIDTEAEREKAKKQKLKDEIERIASDSKKLKKKIEETLKRKNPFRDMVLSAENKKKEYKKELERLSGKVKEFSDDLSHIEFWVKGFSNQGLPSYIMDAVMPFLTSRANHYLETLSDGDIKMEFATQREMKSTKGAYRDEIDINWTIEGVDGTYPPSGGQMKKMEIATDFALMDLVASREGGSVDLLALDEVLDGLDAEGRQRVVQLLKDIRAERGSIFVISHDPDVAEIFEKAIIVTKEEGCSALRIES